MSESLEHAMEWKKALDAKTITAIDDPVNGVIDAVIGYERKTAWMAITREFMKVQNPFQTMIDQMSLYIPLEQAEVAAARLFALVCAEDMGYEVTVETFNNNFGIDHQ